jgi:hypothetical protein
MADEASINHIIGGCGKVLGLDPDVVVERKPHE